MTWLIGLALGGLRGAMAFLKSLTLAQIAVAAGVIALALALWSAHHYKSQRDAQIVKTQAVQSAFDKTVKDYRAAAIARTAADKANVARVLAEQIAKDRKVIDALQIQRDAAASGYGELRAQAAAYSRSSTGPDMSAAREATCRAYAATNCDEIPPLLKAAQDNTDQLLAWIEWGAAQSMIDNNGNPN